MGSGTSRSGETARELIRKTKRVTRRKFPAEEKIRIVVFSCGSACRGPSLSYASPGQGRGDGSRSCEVLISIFANAAVQ
jgi:hypothetical protein